MVASLITLASEEAAHSGPNPYLIGALTLGILLALLFAVMAFGGGRDHS